MNITFSVKLISARYMYLGNKCVLVRGKDMVSMNIKHFALRPFVILFRWMDGAFLDLEAEAIEGEVDEYWREIYKIQKVFNQKVMY